MGMSLSLSFPLIVSMVVVHVGLIVFRRNILKIATILSLDNSHPEFMFHVKDAIMITDFKRVSNGGLESWVASLDDLIINR